MLLNINIGLYDITDLFLFRFLDFNRRNVLKFLMWFRVGEWDERWAISEMLLRLKIFLMQLNFFIFEISWGEEKVIKCQKFCIENLEFPGIKQTGGFWPFTYFLCHKTFSISGRINSILKMKFIFHEEKSQRKLRVWI